MRFPSSRAARATSLGLGLGLLVACGGGDGAATDDGGLDATDDATADGSVDGAPDATDTGLVSDTGPTDTGPVDSGPTPTCPGGTSSGTLPNGTVIGALTFPNPTLRNATVEWAIDGDANENGVVALRYRKVGEAAYRRALPLRRVPAGSVAGFSWKNRHSGSIFDLEPATTYEVEAHLLDPDGGCEVRTGTFTTRAVPAPMAGAPVKAATPSTLGSVLGGAAPGDIVELAEGNYGGFSVGKDGAPGKPIVLRGKGKVTIDGDVSLISRKHVHLTGVTVKGRIRANAGVELAITRNVVTTTSDGIDAQLRCENLYIADNTVTGATLWNVGALGVSGTNVGEGIRVSGPGHVIEHNSVSGFRDGISFMEDGEAVEQHSIDVVENDLRNAADDGIEADFCAHNCRIVRNRLTNVFMGVSSQPGLGGPTYIVRNAMYNVVLSAFKLQRSSVGDVVLHNTVVKNGDALGIYTTDVFSRQWFRNNLFLGGPGGTYNGYSSGSGQVLALSAAAPNGDYDWDGLGSTTGKFQGRLGSVTFASRDELKAKTTYKHAVSLGLDVFAAKVAYPASPFPAFEPVDLALGPGAAVDAATPLPNVNDGWTGAAPDLGALERGKPAPAYGPRP